MNRPNPCSMHCLLLASTLVLTATGTTHSIAQDPDGYPRLMQGPMLGHVTESSFSVWVRTAAPGEVQLAYSQSPTLTESQLSQVVRTTPASDHCAVIQVRDLAPGTKYHYRVLVDSGDDKYQNGSLPFAASTAPKPGSSAKFSIAFGSCARWQAQPQQQIWTVIERYAPAQFFWLGDNVYSDSLAPGTLAEELRRQRDVPGVQRFQANVPQLAIWDDHDFGLNNHDRTNPIKEANLKTWKQYWANPAYGTTDTPGVFFATQYAGVDFFFLDGRYHRDPNGMPDGPDKSMLGNAQVQWLKSSLSKSSSPFKVLVSGSTWMADKGQGGDAWSSYQHERDSLFQWIMQSGIEGVLLISGDTHTGELNVTPAQDADSYDLFDFVASPLAQEPDNDWLFRQATRVRLPYNSGENFGLLEFDTDLPNPTVTMRLIGLHGKDVWEPLTLRASDLSPGTSTWKDQQSEDAEAWMQRVGDNPR